MRHDSRDVAHPEVYDVEQVLDVRKNAQTGTLEYKVRWRGYSDAEDTWEPLKHLNCHEARHRSTLPEVSQPKMSLLMLNSKFALHK